MPYWIFTADGSLVLTAHAGQGYFPKTDGRTVLFHDGISFWAWNPETGNLTVILGVPIGNNPTGISSNGTAFFQRLVNGNGAIYCGNTIVASYCAMGIWEAYDDGFVLRMDDVRTPAWAPWAGGYAHRSGPIIVGEGAQGGTLIGYNGEVYVLGPGDNQRKTPRTWALSGDLVAVVSWGDLGLRLDVFTLAELVTFPVYDPAPVVTVPPAPAHLKGCGYYYRDTAVHAYIATYGGENPSAPGTHSVILDDYGMPAEPHPDGHTPRMIIGTSQLLLGQTAAWWDRIDAVHIVNESPNPAGIAESARFARMLMRERGLPPKPLLSYTAGNVFPMSLADTDILGVQLYAERGTDPVANIRAQAVAIWPQIQHRTRVAIVGQAYDRGGWVNDEQLVALQYALYDVACEWTNCEMLLWFSDSRVGGTRDHEAMRPVHQAIYEMIRES